MFEIFHVSDLHFHSDPVDNQNVREKLNQVHDLLTGVVTRGTTPLVLITGDITDDGHPEQYQEAYRSLAPIGTRLSGLGGRLFLSPGNHDVGGSGIFYHESCTRAFDELCIKLGYQRTYFPKKSLVSHLVKDIYGNKLMIIGLNGCIQTTSPFDWSCGKIGKRQREQLAALLDNQEARDIPKLVHMHFHPFMHSDPTMKLVDADKLLKVMSGKVQVVCFGHKHEQKIWSSQNTYCKFVAAGSLPQRSNIVKMEVDCNSFPLPRISITEPSL